MSVIVDGGNTDTSDKVNRTGDTMTGPLTTYAMQYTTIPVGETVTIPAGTQMIVAGGITVDGTLVQDGTLVVIPDDALSAANDLSDLNDAATARNNLGLGSAATAATGDFDAAGAAAAAQAASQPLDADLTAIAGLSSADSNFIVGSATGWVAESGATARTSLGLGTIATAAAGDYPLLSSFSAAPTAAEPLKADGNGGIRPKKLAVGAALQSGAVVSAHYNAGASLAFYIRESDGKSFWAAPGGFAIGGGVYPLALAHDGAAAVITNSVGDLRIYNTAAGAIRFRTSNAARLAIEDTTITASVSITPASLADASAPNGTIYYSTTAGKLVFKDSGGTVNNLY